MTTLESTWIILMVLILFFDDIRTQHLLIVT